MVAQIAVHWFQASGCDGLEGHSFWLQCTCPWCSQVKLEHRLSKVFSLYGPFMVDPYVYQFLQSRLIDNSRGWRFCVWVFQSHLQSVSIMFQLTLLSWLPWNTFCNVQKVLISLCSIQGSSGETAFRVSKDVPLVTTWSHPPYFHLISDSTQVRFLLGLG